MNKKQSVLITGTSSGVGHTLAKSFLEKDFLVYGIARRDVSFNNKNYEHLSIDLSKLDSIKCITNLLNHKLDILIHNASQFYLGNLDTMDDKTIESILDVNLKGAIFLSKYTIPKMKKDSRIIFINSVAGKSELARQSIYCASKHGVSAFANILNEELKEKGIKISSIYPGGIDTPLWNTSNPYPGKNKERLLASNDISELIHYIISQRQNIHYKSIILYPDNESH